MSIVKSIANKYNRPSSKFDFESGDLEFTSLAVLYENGGIDETYLVKGLFINTKGKFGEQPVIVTPDFLTSLPTYMNDTVKEMLKDDDVINACNSDLLGFNVRSYTTRNNELFYTIDWVDVKPKKDVTNETK